MRLELCLFPENDFNLHPGSLANGPKAKSASTEVGHVWDHYVKCDGEKDTERGDRQKEETLTRVVVASTEKQPAELPRA